MEVLPSYKGKGFIPCWASKGRTYKDVESEVRPESAYHRREPPESAYCDRNGLSAEAGLVRPESAFRRSGLPHMSEVCYELEFVEVVLPPDLLDD